MRIEKKSSGNRHFELAAPEAALLRQALESTVAAYRTPPAELDPMVGNVWYRQAGLREAGIRGNSWPRQKAAPLWLACPPFGNPLLHACTRLHQRRTALDGAKDITSGKELPCVVLGGRGNLK